MSRTTGTYRVTRVAEESVRGGTWDQFVRRHAQTLWACDFLSVKTWTLRGRFDLYLLFFIHVETRRVWISPATAQPDESRMNQQARNFSNLKEQKLQATHLIRDRDGKFTGAFDAILEAEGAEIVRLPICSPNLNAYAERFIQTLQSECLDHFVILGCKHLNYLTREFAEYYHARRPHQGRENRLLLGSDDGQSLESSADSTVFCDEQLGGFLKHYYRKAA